jgi:hypothetical protein
MVDRLLSAGFHSFALDAQGACIPISIEKLRSFEGQMDLVMISPAAS